MMASKQVTVSMLVLRIFALLFLAGSIVVLIISKLNVQDDQLGVSEKHTFKDIYAYTYMFTAAVIGAAYTLFQLPFAIYHVSTEKRFIRNGCLPEFDFYADKVIGWVVATGVGAGFGYTVDTKRFWDKIYKEIIADAQLSQVNDTAGLVEEKQKFDDFYNKIYISASLLLGSFICLALVSILSSSNRKRGLFG